MRVINFIILSLCFFLFPFLSLSQSSNLNNRIKIAATQIPLDSLSVNVFRQANYIFSFNSKIIKHRIAITLNKKEILLGDLLSIIQQQLNVRYRINDNYIIFYPKNLTVNKNNFENLDQKLMAKSGKGNHIFINSKDSAKRIFKDISLSTITISINKNKFIIQTPKLYVADSLATSRRLLPQVTVANNYFKDKSSSHNSIIGKNILSPTVFAGISADETMYINANINAGFRWLFGTFDLSSNFKKSILLYGIGTSFPLGEKWFIQLSGLTGGRASNNYRLKSKTDSSVIKDLSAKAFLSRFNFTVKKQFMPRVQLEFGTVFNIMHAKYYLDNSLVSLKSLLPNIQKPDDIYYAIKPPYTIINTLNSNSLNDKKMWIGFRIGLTYIFK